MTRQLTVLVVGASLLLWSTSVVVADVRADQKTKVEFGGALGRVVNIFGGKAAREGVTTSVAVKGDRKATLGDSTGQIVDLNEEKVYDLDLKKKTYRVTTFADLRKQMEDAKRKAEENTKQEPAAEQPPATPKDETAMAVDFEVKETGQRKTINGFDTRESVAIVTVREKGKTLEQSGGLVLTTNMWLTPKVAAMNEVLAFDIRYAQKLYGPMVAGASAQEMAAAAAMFPMIAPAIERMRTEGVRLDGTAILTVTTVEGVKSGEQFAAEQKRRADQDKAAAGNSSGGVSGLVGGFARRAAVKTVEGEPKQRATAMTSSVEVLKIVTDVAVSDVAVPAGFKETK